MTELVANLVGIAPQDEELQTVSEGSDESAEVRSEKGRSNDKMLAIDSQEILLRLMPSLPISDTELWRTTFIYQNRLKRLMKTTVYAVCSYNLLQVA